MQEDTQIEYDYRTSAPDRAGPLPETIPLNASVATKAAQLRISAVAPGEFALGSVGNVGIQVWVAQGTAEGALAVRTLAEAVAADFPGGMSSIHFLKGGTELPGSEARSEFARLLRDFGDQMGEVVIVLDAGGFWASAVRAMINGIRIASGGRVSLSVARDFREVLDWFPEANRKTTGVLVSERELAAAMSTLLEAAQAPPAV